MSSNAKAHEDGDQKNALNSEARFHEGQPNSHLANDSKDQRSIANKLESELRKEHEPEPEAPEVTLLKKDATLPAKSHGNEPSRGAKIDQQLAEEDAAAVKAKGSFGPSN